MHEIYSWRWEECCRLCLPVLVRLSQHFTPTPKAKSESENNSRSKPGNYFNYFFQTGKMNSWNIAFYSFFLSSLPSATTVNPRRGVSSGSERKERGDAASDRPVTGRQEQLVAMSLGHHSRPSLPTGVPECALQDSLLVLPPLSTLNLETQDIWVTGGLIRYWVQTPPFF